MDENNINDNVKDENLDNSINEENNTNQDVLDKELTPEQIEKRKKNRRALIIAVSIILPALIIFTIKQIQKSQMRKNHAYEISLLKQEAADYVRQSNENNLKIITRVLSWAVNDALKAGLPNTALDYMTLTVKENNFKQIMVVNKDGVIELSTDKKSEKAHFENPFPAESIPTDSVKLRILPTGDYMLAASMYKIDTRLGVLILTASPDSIKFSEKK